MDTNAVALDTMMYRNRVGQWEEYVNRDKFLFHNVLTYTP
jgi:hypothetical protein